MFSHRLLTLTALLAFTISNISAMQSARSFNNAKTTFAKQSNSTQKRDLHIDLIKNCYTNLTDQAKPYSIVHGSALFESNWLKNMFQFGDTSHATVQLVNGSRIGLFNINRHGQFCAVENLSFPGYSLNPHLLGTIIGTLAKKEFNNNSVKKEIAGELRAEHKKITGDAITHKRVNELLDCITASEQECSTDHEKKLYLPNMTESILLGFLHGKSKSRSDILGYYQSLNRFIPIFNNTVDNSTERWLNDRFNDDDFEYLKNIFNHSNIENSALFDKDTIYEQLIHFLILAKISSLPPMVNQAGYPYQDQPYAPDCMEAVMRGFFYWLLANKQEGTPDFKMLPVSIKPRSEFKDYFIKHNNYKFINNNIKAGQEWMNICSSHEFLRYKRGNYDLNPRISNFLKLTNHLLNTSAKDLDELGILLSDKRRTVSFKLEKTLNDLTDNHNRIYITIGKYNLTVNLVPGHGSLEVPKDTSNHIKSAERMHQLRHYLEDNLLHQKDLRKSSSLLPLTYSNLFRLKQASAYPATLIHNYLSADLDDPNILLSRLSAAILELNQHPQLISLVLQNLSRLPNDAHFKHQIGCDIGRTGIYNIDQRFDEYIKTNPIATVGAVKSISSLLVEYLKEQPCLGSSSESLLPRFAQKLINECNALYKKIDELLSLINDQRNKQEALHYFANKLAYEGLFNKNEKIDEYIFDAIVPIDKNKQRNEINIQEKRKLITDVISCYRDRNGVLTFESRLSYFFSQGKNSLLNEAIKQHNLEVIQQLLDIGVDLNINDSLREAIWSAPSSHAAQIIKLLIGNGARINESMVIEIITRSQLCPSEIPEILRLILSNHPEWKQKIFYQFHNYLDASQAGMFYTGTLPRYLDNIEFFFKAGVSADIKSELPHYFVDPTTPLEIAIRKDKPDLIKLILKYNPTITLEHFKKLKSPDACKLLINTEFAKKNAVVINQLLENHPSEWVKNCWEILKENNATFKVI